MKMSALFDTWGHPYQYRNPSKRHPLGVDVCSMGPDGKDGTEDDVYGK
ncbi:MAG: type secretion system protein GspG [Verrucomicrobiaceae bacterium]|nr:type secretion system protein GspG [Verrucomicrobiaceae bacterium]